MLRFLFLIAISSAVSWGQCNIFGFGEQYTILSEEAVPQVNFWIQSDFCKMNSNGDRVASRWGLFSWSQASKYYKLAEGGVSYRITPSLQVGIGGGGENIVTHERVVTFGLYAKGKDFVFATIETGGSGRWHQALYSRSIGRFEVGGMSQEFLGISPRFAWNIGPVKIWTAPIFVEKQGGHWNQNAIVGVRYVFSKP